MTASLVPQQVIMPPGIPDNAVPIVAIVFGTIMIMVIMTPIIRAVIRAVERRHTPPATPALPVDLSARLDRIEQTVESIAVEIERVAEGQRFLTRIQTEQRAIGATQPPPR